MARRIVRTAVQFSVITVLFLCAIFLIDSKYDVLPSAIQNRLPAHNSGYVVTDITYQSCSNIKIFGSCTLDKEWQRIEKDVFLGKSFFKKGYVHIKRVKEAEFDASKGDRAVSAVYLGKRQPVDGQDDTGPDKHAGTWESRPGGMWIKREDRVHAGMVNAVDVLFGPDAVDARTGWEVQKGSLDIGEEPRLSIRFGKEHEKPLKRPVPRMRKDGKFKIMQVSDMHLSTGLGTCRDAWPPETADKCDADHRTLEFVEKMLDEEKPDLVVFSGDQVNGDTAPDAATAIFKFGKLLAEKKIPYAAIMGNHDDEGNLNREEMMQLTSSLPYSVSRVGPALGNLGPDGKPEGGYGNYYVEILSHRSDHSAITLWMFDSHGYSKEPGQKGYDYIKESQIQWFKETKEKLREEHNKYAYMHLDFAFLHIPLPEYRTSTNPILGNWLENPTAPRYNSGLRTALSAAGVRIVSAGHDHANDYCMLDNPNLPPRDRIWLCYGGGAGFGGYGGYGGLIRKLRLFEVEAQAGLVRTWKRLEWGDKGRVDEQVVVNGGAVVFRTADT